MVRFATDQLRAGHLPLTSWFPFLGEGSAQFLHYQSLPAIVTGAAGLLVGPDVAFRWSLYLLLALWPISVYLAARAFGGGRPAAAVSAAMSPFLVSVTGVGYEQHAYLWTGYGVWTQLWAMWTLPLAWGCSWRAIRDGRGYLSAVLCTALTVAFHFETGYLALSVLVLWPLVAGRPLLVRLRRAAVLLGGSALASAWVIVPLLSEKGWAAVNEPLQGTQLVDGYGARHVLDWLLSGQLLDHGRLPVITILAGLGFALAWLVWSSDVDARALMVALGVCLLLSFGRTTFGSLADVIPGSHDIFFRRFMMGVQLVALLLAGRGAAWLADRAWRLLELRLPRRAPRFSPLIGLLAVVVVLAPAWLELGTSARADAAAIEAQRAADHAGGAALDRLVAVIRRDGGGRTYAGMPQNWGEHFTVGQIPVFKYLESRDVDEVGYTLRTASLMTDPEYYFDERDPSDYTLFAVRFLILPAGRRPPVAAHLAMRAGPYRLWTVGAAGYIRTGRIVGTLAANRTNVGTRSIPLLRSGLAAEGDYLGVDWGARGAGSTEAAELPTTTGHADQGSVTDERADLSGGHAAATVHMRHPGVAVLSASYDPGWTVTVNGRPKATRMVAPALVGVDVPAGTSRVVFSFQGYGGYPWWLALCAISLATLGLGPRSVQLVRSRRGTRGKLRPGQAPQGPI
jgi:hypothetical protein